MNLNVFQSIRLQTKLSRNRRSDFWICAHNNFNMLLHINVLGVSVSFSMSLLVEKTGALRPIAHISDQFTTTQRET